MTHLRPLDRHAHGFTALELAAVLAVTAIVGALGVSAYRTYATRAQIATSVAAAAPIQERIAAAFVAAGQPPADRHAAGLGDDGEAKSEFVTGLTIVDGRIELRFGGAADTAIADKTLSLTPFETADQRIVWVCGNQLPGVGLEPLGFAGGGRQAVQVLTAIEARYLPSTCR